MAVLLRRWPALHRARRPVAPHSVWCSPFAVDPALGFSRPPVPPALVRTRSAVLRLARPWSLSCRAPPDASGFPARRTALLGFRPLRHTPAWHHRSREWDKSTSQPRKRLNHERSRSGVPVASGPRHLPSTRFDYLLDGLLPAAPDEARRLRSIHGVLPSGPCSSRTAVPLSGPRLS